MPLERNFERRIGNHCKSNGWLWLKFGTSGWPDRLLILPGGHHVWMELKTGSTVTPLQKKRIETLKQIGAHAHVIRSFEDFIFVADTIRRRELPGGA